MFGRLKPPRKGIRVTIETADPDMHAHDVPARKVCEGAGVTVITDDGNDTQICAYGAVDRIRMLSMLIRAFQLTPDQIIICMIAAGSLDHQEGAAQDAEAEEKARAAEGGDAP